MSDMIHGEIARRTERAQKLAQKYPELAGTEYGDFVEATLDAGLELDFITSSEMWKALNPDRERS